MQPISNIATQKRILVDNDVLPSIPPKCAHIDDSIIINSPEKQSQIEIRNISSNEQSRVNIVNERPNAKVNKNLLNFAADVESKYEDFVRQMKLMNSLNKSENSNTSAAASSILLNIRQLLFQQQGNLAVLHNNINNDNSTLNTLKNKNNDKNSTQLSTSQASTSKMTQPNDESKVSNSGIENHSNLQNTQINAISSVVKSSLNSPIVESVNKTLTDAKRLTIPLPSLPTLNSEKTNLYREAGYKAFKNLVNTLPIDQNQLLAPSNSLKERLLSISNQNKNTSDKNVETEKKSVLSSKIQLSSINKPSTSTLYTSALKRKIAPSDSSSTDAPAPVSMTLSEALCSITKDNKMKSYNMKMYNKLLTTNKHVNNSGPAPKHPKLAQPFLNTVKNMLQSSSSPPVSTSTVSSSDSGNFQWNFQALAKFIDEQLLKVPEQERQKILIECKQKNITGVEAQRFVMNKVLENLRYIPQNQSQGNFQQQKNQQLVKSITSQTINPQHNLYAQQSQSTTVGNKNKNALQMQQQQQQNKKKLQQKLLISNLNTLSKNNVHQGQVSQPLVQNSKVSDLHKLTNLNESQRFLLNKQSQCILNASNNSFNSSSMISQNKSKSDMLSSAQNLQNSLSTQQQYLYYMFKTSMEQDKLRNISHLPTTSSSSNLQQSQISGAFDLQQQKTVINNIRNNTVNQKSTNMPQVNSFINLAKPVTQSNSIANSSRNNNNVKNQEKNNLNEQYLNLQRFFQQQRD